MKFSSNFKCFILRKAFKKKVYVAILSGDKWVYSSNLANVNTYDINDDVTTQLSQRMLDSRHPSDI